MLRSKQTLYSTSPIQFNFTKISKCKQMKWFLEWFKEFKQVTKDISKAIKYRQAITLTNQETNKKVNLLVKKKILYPWFHQMKHFQIWARWIQVIIEKDLRMINKLDSNILIFFLNKRVKEEWPLKQELLGKETLMKIILNNKLYSLVKIAPLSNWDKNLESWKIKWNFFQINKRGWWLSIRWREGMLVRSHFNPIITCLEAKRLIIKSMKKIMKMMKINWSYR